MISKPRVRKKRKSTRYARYTPEYQAWRLEVKGRDGCRCVKCRKKLKRLHIHHIEPYSKFPELRLITSNGATLCKKCHKIYHKIYGITKNVNKNTFLVFLQPDIGGVK